MPGSRSPREERKNHQATAMQKTLSRILSSPAFKKPILTLLTRGVKVSIDSNAERGADASREGGADEGRAFFITIAASAAAPAWPIEATMISFFSVACFVVAVAAAAVSKAASGAIFTTIVSKTFEMRSGTFLLRGGEKEEEEEKGFDLTFFSFFRRKKCEKGRGRALGFFFPQPLK